MNGRRRGFVDVLLVAILSGVAAWILQVALRAYAGVEPPMPWGIVASTLFAASLFAALVRELFRSPAQPSADRGGSSTRRVGASEEPPPTSWWERWP